MNCPTIPGFAQFSFQSWDWLNPEIDGICHSQPLITKMSHLSTEHKIGAEFCTKYISNFHNNILGTVWAQFCLFYRHQNQDQGIRLKQILSDIKVKNPLISLNNKNRKCNAINKSYTILIEFNSSFVPKLQHTAPKPYSTQTFGNWPFFFKLSFFIYIWVYFIAF